MDSKKGQEPKPNVRNYTPLPPQLSQAKQPRVKKLQLLRKLKFLDALRSKESAGVVIVASEISGIPWRTAYDWKKEDKIFADAWDEAVLEGAQRIKEEAYFSFRKLVLANNPTIILRMMEVDHPELVGRRASNEYGNGPTQINNITYYDFSNDQREKFNKNFDEWFNEKYRKPKQVLNTT